MATTDKLDGEPEAGERRFVSRPEHPTEAIDPTNHHTPEGHGRDCSDADHRKVA